MENEEQDRYLSILFFAFLATFIVLVLEACFRLVKVFHGFYLLWLDTPNLRISALIYLPLFALAVASAAWSIFTVIKFLVRLARDAARDKKRRRDSLNAMKVRTGV